MHSLSKEYQAMNIQAPKCPVCSKSVYKMEEMVAMGHTWHKACFTCGVLGKEAGCNRTMNRENYQDHSGAPYCNSCYSRLFKPKGFGYGNAISMDSSPGQASVTPSDVKYESTNKVRRSSGGSAGLAAMLSSGGGSGGITMSPPVPSPPTAAVATPPPAPAPVATPPAAPSPASAPKSGSGCASTTASVPFNKGTPKCPICTKSVYKMEEILAMGSTWHKTCFKCGAGSKDSSGCSRTLTRDGYQDHDGAPYCNACYGRLYKPKGFGYGNMLNTEEGSKKQNQASPASPSAPSSTSSASASVPFKPAPSKAAASPPKVPASVTVGAGGYSKCPVCSKSVYKMEEMVAMGHTWHKACFTCGVLGKEAGCNRTMNRENYQDHSGAPYCNSCYSRLFKPKGFGYGNAISMDSSPGQASVTPSDVKYESTNKVRRSSGGSAGLAAMLSSGGGSGGITMSPPVPSPPTAAVATPPPAPAPVATPPVVSSHASAPEVASTAAVETSPVAVDPMSQNSRPVGGSAGLAAMISSNNTSKASTKTPEVSKPSPPWKTNMRSADSALTPTSGIAEKAEHHPKCPACEKNVYKMEEIVAMSRTWHKACFVCGANRKDGCKKTLSRDGFLEASNAPYCLNCHKKLHGAQNIQNLTASVTAMSTKSTTKQDMHPSEVFSGDGDEVDESEW